MSFAVWGIAILALIASIIGGIAVHDGGIRSAQMKADEAAVLACQSNVSVCMAANESIASDCREIGKQRDEQTEAVKGWKQLADRAATVAQNNLDANKSTLAQLSAAQRDARAKAGRPATGQTMLQMCEEIDADSKDLATKRAILFPPTAAPDAVRVK